MNGYCCFPGFVILPVRMHFTACLAFCLVKIFLLKLLGFKIYFHIYFQVLFLTFEVIVKEKKIDLSHESVQSLHFLTRPKVEAIFFKSKAYVKNLMLCDWKYKDEVEENRKVLVPITDTFITWERLGLPFRGHLNESNYHQRKWS